MAGLSKHIDTDELLEHVHKTYARGKNIVASEKLLQQSNPYSSRYSAFSEIPKYRIPQDGAPGEAVAQMIRDELDLDGRPNLNLASFVHTWMDKHATDLIMENISKNMSDADEYPSLMQISSRVINIVGDLWGGGRNGEKPIGTPTTGSSEAIHLGGLAMKRRWQERRQKEGKDSSKPNIIMGANAQVALEKFARYFEVEARILPVTQSSNYVLDPKLIKENLDENTIGVFIILGSTYTGHYEPVEEIHGILDEYEKESGISVDIHVDAASGGFVAPFAHAKAGQKWNFELPRVKSINTSGHKYGLVYAGLGLIIWRDEALLPKHLIFELHYLGQVDYSYTLNFSRPGAQVIGMYYNLVQLGFKGYRAIVENDLANARVLSKALEYTQWFRCVSNIHRKKGVNDFDPKEPTYTPEKEDSSAYNPGLPVVSFTLSDAFKKAHPHVKQEAISNLLRAKQIIVPNYPLPPNEEKTEILRIVVRESMSLDLVDKILKEIIEIMEMLKSTDSDASTLAVWQPGASTEHVHGRAGLTHKDKHKSSRPMHKGIHRSVC